MASKPNKTAHHDKDSTDLPEFEAAAADGAPTPLANPTAPVGGVITGTTGIDRAGNVWLMAGPPRLAASWTFVATVAFPAPYPAALVEPGPPLLGTTGNWLREAHRLHPRRHDVMDCWNIPECRPWISPPDIATSDSFTLRPGRGKVNGRPGHQGMSRMGTGRQ